MHQSARPAIEHASLGPADGVEPEAFAGTDQGRLAIVLEAAATVSLLASCGCAAPAGFAGAVISRDGHLGGVTFGPSEWLPDCRTVLGDLLETLFGGHRVPGRGQARRGARELLITIAIIGILAALLVPNLLEALNKSKQKRSMTDIRLSGTAWFSWITDQVGSGAAGTAVSTFDWSNFSPATYAVLEADLVPTYASYLPPKDAWGNPYEYGVTGSVNDLVPPGIRSPGSDATFSGDSYTPGAFFSTDFVQDIVWAGGHFIRWPAGHLAR